MEVGNLGTALPETSYRQHKEDSMLTPLPFGLIRVRDSFVMQLDHRLVKGFKISEQVAVIRKPKSPESYHRWVPASKMVFKEKN